MGVPENTKTGFYQPFLELIIEPLSLRWLNRPELREHAIRMVTECRADHPSQ